MSVAPQAFGEKPYSQEEINESLEEFYIVILPLIDKKLHKAQFLCGDEFTVVDLLLYNEINTVAILYDRFVTSRDAPNLFDWYNQMSKVEEVHQMDQLLHSIIEKYKLA